MINMLLLSYFYHAVYAKVSLKHVREKRISIQKSFDSAWFTLKQWEKVTLIFFKKVTL